MKFALFRALFMLAILVVLIGIAIFVIIMPKRTITLSIIHFNDLHAHFEEVAPFGILCKDNKTACIGGFGRLMASAKKIYNTQPNPIVLNAGDLLTGSMVVKFHNWTRFRKLVDMLQVDAHAFGDCDLFALVSQTKEQIGGPCKAPFITCNLDNTFDSLITYVYNNTNSVIIERDGYRIGIIGVVHNKIDEYAPMGGIIISDEVESINKEVKRLKEQNVFTMILLSHCGYEEDKFLAKKIPRDITVIVGGHSHTVLYSGSDDFEGLSVKGPYPTVVDRDGEHKVLIVSAGYYGMFLGNLSVVYDRTGRIESWSGAPIFLSQDIKPDPEATKFLAPFLKDIEPHFTKIIGKTDVHLFRKICYFQECKFGNLITDAMFEMVNSMNDDTCKPSIVVINPSKIHSTMKKGDITFADVVHSLPTENILVCVYVDGWTLTDAISYSMEPRADGRINRKLLQVHGMKVVIDASTDAVSISINDKEIDRSEKLTMLTTEYLLHGGDGFNMFKNNLEVIKMLGSDLQAFKQYIEKHSPVKPKLEQRIVIKNDEDNQDIKNIQHEIREFIKKYGKDD